MVWRRSTSDHIDVYGSLPNIRAMKSTPQRSIILEAPRLTSVLSRLEINLDELLSARSTPVLELAVLACLSCERTNRCDRWIAAHEEGAPNVPPTHCPLTVLMTAAQAGRPANDQ